MAGKSSRFLNAGFTLPKFMLPLWGKTVFDFVLMSFRSYFETERFIFVVQATHNCEDFVADHASELGILDFQIVVLEEFTKGQAQTVDITLARLPLAPVEHLLIFNIDTLRPNFRLPALGDHFGWLETFIGEGDQWSFVLPLEKGSDTVAKVSEKVRISDFCSTGAYWFKDIKSFRESYESHKNNSPENQEHFVAPIYNYLIEKKNIVKFTAVEASVVLPCGVPSEYEKLRENQHLKKMYEEIS